MHSTPSILSARACNTPLLDGLLSLALQNEGFSQVYAIYEDVFACAICETASAMAQMLAPEVRSQFAQRLKNLRTQRGFDRARYFARSLGIEENRYTRYERAEVEPSLTLIHKMCETLRVSPNELLGFADLGHLFSGGVPALAEAPAEQLDRHHPCN